MNSPQEPERLTLQETHTSHLTPTLTPYGPHIQEWVESPTPLRLVRYVELNSCDVLYEATPLHGTILSGSSRSSFSLHLPHKQLVLPVALPDLPLKG